MKKNTSKILTFLKSPYFLWSIVSIPAVPLLANIANYPISKESYEQVMKVTGELSARLLVISLLISPVTMFFKGKISKWFKKNKKHFGLLSFGYALIHTVAYLIYKSGGEVLAEISELRYFTGWVAMIIMLPLALTSTHYAVRKLSGRRWKTLHRTVYACAVFTLLHWLLLEKGLAPALVHFTPLMILEAVRFYKYRAKMATQELKTAPS